MSLEQEVAALREQVQRLTVANKNMITRGTVVEVTDDDGIQKMKIRGMYGEELADVQSLPGFGVSGNPPAGADVIIASAGGSKDGAQVIAVAHNQYRTSSQSPGDMAMSDAHGNSVVMNSGSVAIKSAGPLTIEAGGDITIKGGNVKIESGELTHNGKNIGDTHVHTKVVAGGATSGEPA